MDKKLLHHAWTKLRRLKPWYFLVLALLSAAVCLFALRANNEHMVKLRSALYGADQNNGNVQQALRNLQAYVTSHMNTSLSTGNTSVYPPLQLAGTYDRLVRAQGVLLQQQNGQLYTDAQHYCEQQDSVDFSGHNRVPCIEQYVQSHGVKVTPIPDSLYKFDFISPRWSPDLAGWSMVLSVVSLALFLLLFAMKALSKRAVQ